MKFSDVPPPPQNSGAAPVYSIYKFVTCTCIIFTFEGVFTVFTLRVYLL